MTIGTYNTALILHSALETVKQGKMYAVLSVGKQSFIFDETGRRQEIKNPQIKFQILDPVVLIVKIKSSLLDSILLDNIYRVFEDAKNDERYIVDANGERVLFDKMLFKYEVI